MSHTSTEKRSIVIVGASNKPDRTSHQLLQRILAMPSFTPILIHPTLKEIDGVPVLPSLSSVTIRPDVVSLYVGPAISDSLELELKRINPKKIIFNPGAENPALEKKLRAEKIDTEEACSLVLLSQRAL